jgi:hypothetical protein
MAAGGVAMKKQKRCLYCGHTLAEHEDTGWVCDCTLCPDKPRPVEDVGEALAKAFGVETPAAREKARREDITVRGARLRGSGWTRER